MSHPRLLWQPSDAFMDHSHLRHFMAWLKRNRDLEFMDYDALWRWSTTQIDDFWPAVWEYFKVISYQPYQRVRSGEQMWETQWFEGSTLNYAEHIFRQKTDARPAILFQSERQALTAISWKDLEEQVAKLVKYLQQCGVVAGDRVVAFIPNIPAATVGFLAACSLGAIWSSASPDFGADSVVERFRQIEPKVMIAVDGYAYGGKGHDKQATVQAIASQLPSLEQVILLPYLDVESGVFLPGAVTWESIMATDPTPLRFEALPFAHPIWVLYSSGTTGIPKAITHSHGGVLLEHLKYVHFHNDVKPGENYFWYSTTGWMMWNFIQATLLAGATIVLYDGSPAYPDLSVLWKLAEQAPIHHFGTSAPYLVACLKKGIHPGQNSDLSQLRSLSSTGAPLPPEGFAYVHESIKQDLWLASMSGGTDVCTAFVGGVSTEPVYEGEIQRRALGCAMESWSDAGTPLVDEVGEMVITQPMPSMPIYFWNDPAKKRYQSSYFEHFPGVWRHGDWLQITPRNTLVILGRSDAILNRQGIRIGTAEIYRAVNQVPAIADSLIVNLELAGGRHYMPLFVKMAAGKALDDAVVSQVKTRLREAYSPRHVPDELIVVPDIPYTISGKKLEAPVKKILMGISVDQAANPGAMRNPDSLTFFLDFRKKIS
ncbi:MAG: acetoacetate--CoA ligase [Bacteroidota bacterium]